ncbi:uncharacterized protein LOC113798939 isoform X3 [Dermatophagoides pteronyssinus]|uniref:uncharacterized protein LOC113798939 isoform X3 n=1 Tax=Dermatophagoides pteronyssinus TaxID=6956 RepID=UPI003F67F6E9
MRKREKLDVKKEKINSFVKVGCVFYDKKKGFTGFFQIKSKMIDHHHHRYKMRSPNSPSSTLIIMLKIILFILINYCSSILAYHISSSSLIISNLSSSSLSTPVSSIQSKIDNKSSLSNNQYMEDIDEQDDNDDDDDEYLYDEKNGYYKKNNNLTKNSNNNDQYETLSSENHQHRLINIDNNNNNNNNDFCNENYIDSAYFNGYDTIITRGNNLWYYYKDRRNRHLSRSFDQRRFTQGDYIQGAFNISRTPLYCLNNHEKQRRQIRQSSLMDQSIGLYSTNRLSNIDQQQRRQRQKSMPLRSKSTVADHLNQQRSSGQSTASQSQTLTGHCEELQKLRSTAIYFLHNKQHQRSYYNLDVRYPNGTQRRVRSRDLPWNMKQVGLLTGNLWPNGWELYQQFRPVAFLPSRFEMIFILNEHNFDQELSILNLYADNEQQQRFQSKRLINNNNKNQTEKNFVQKSPILIWNNLDAINWNQSWRTKLLDFEPPIHSNSVRRIGKMYQYYVTDNDGRNFKELNQTVQEFFGCPKSKISTTTTTSTTTMKPSVTSRTSTTSSFSSMTSATSHRQNPIVSKSTTTTTTTTKMTPRPSTTTTIATTKKTTMTTTTTTTPKPTVITTISTTSTSLPTTIMKNLESSSSKSFNDNEEEYDNEDDDSDDESSNDIDDSLSSTIPPIDHIIIPKKKSSLSYESSNHSISIQPNNTITEEFDSSETPSSSSSSTSVFLRNSRAKISSSQSTINKSIRNDNQPLGSSSSSSNSGSNVVRGTTLLFPKLATAGSSYPTVTLRETDSIMLTILIAIVIGASILCIILACLVINGKKRPLPPHFEGGHRIEPAIPKPTIIGLDYHRRKNSTTSSLTPFNFLARYDSMNSLTAIYSQVNHHPGLHHSHHSRPPSSRSQLSPVIIEPTSSPNLHALHPTHPTMPPPPPPPPPVPSTISPPTTISRNVGGPILHHKSISVNLNNPKSGHHHHHHHHNHHNHLHNSHHKNHSNHYSSSSIVVNPESNQIAEEIPGPSTKVGTSSPSNNHHQKQQQSSSTSSNRIKSFERFENLI